jgi:hypothetical protein
MHSTLIYVIFMMVDCIYCECIHFMFQKVFKMQLGNFMMV